MVLSLLLLETALRLGGFVLASIGEYENLRSVKQKGIYRILCLGESTTFRQYPSRLERILNQRSIGVHFKVIDRGKPGTDTPAILSEVESYLDKYHPDMVIAMMGTNDRRIPYYEDIPEADTWIFKHCRAYRFLRVFSMRFMRQIRTGGVYSSDAAFLEKGLKGDVAPKAGHSEIGEFPGAMAGLNPLSDKTYLGLGEFYREQGQLLEAVDCFERAIELDPRSDRAYIGLGWVFFEQEELPRAKESFAKALEFNPENSYAYSGSGWCCLARKDFSEAEILFKKALEFNPQNENAFAGLGRLCRLKGRFSEAEAFLKKALTINSGNHFTSMELGSIYQLQGRSTAAEDLFKNFIKASLQTDQAYTDLGRFYRDQGQPFPAETLIRKALALNPKNSEAYFELGMLCKVAKRFSEAEASLKKAVDLDPNHFQAYIEWVELCRLQGQYAQAEGLLKKAVEANPKNDRILGAIIMLYEEMGKTELAKEYAERAKRSRSMDYSEISVRSYRKLREILGQRGIKLVCVQYPMRSLATLSKIFEGEKDVVFVDNESVFRDAVKHASYQEYFSDMFAGDFGHCTRKGNELLAKNIANVIMREVFGK